MELTEYYDLLEAHDWYFAMSDDGYVYRMGLANLRKLEEIAKLSPAHTALLKEYSEHMFTGKPWNTPKAPKPERPISTKDRAHVKSAA